MISIKNKISALIRFKNSWLIFPLLLFILYVPQAFWGMHVFGDKSAVQFILILILGLLAYFAIYLILKKIGPVSLGILNAGSTIKRASDYFIPVVSAIYFLLIAYVLLTAEKIALLEAFRGASADDIAFAREALFKTRVGWERLLPYLNSIFSSALMPFALMISYLEKRRYRHWLFLLFCLSLFPSLEKVLILKAVVPLIMLVLNGYLPRRWAILLIGSAIFTVGAAFYLAKSGDVDYLKQSRETMAHLRWQQNLLPDTWRNDLNSKIKDSKEYRSANDYYMNYERNLLQQIEFTQGEIRTIEKYSPFGSSPSAYKTNRLLWIPYVTAYDWILFFNDRLDGRLLKGATSTLLAKLLGQDNFLMEREVFKFQFGSGGAQTGAANAVFLADAFVNFGWLGVALYASFLAILIYVVTILSNPAMQACLYYFLIQLSIGPLPGVLFSNGLLLLIVLSIFIRPKEHVPNLAKVGVTL